MLFSKRVFITIILVSLLVPAVVRIERDYFLPWIADQISFKDFGSQAPLYVDKPVRILGTTMGPMGLINTTLWNNVGPQLLLRGPELRISNESTILLTHFPYIIFLDGIGEDDFYLARANRNYANLRLQYGLLSLQEIPIAFDHMPGEVPQEAYVIAYCRVLSVQGFIFYFLEFQSWQQPS